MVMPIPKLGNGVKALRVAQCDTNNLEDVAREAAMFADFMVNGLGISRNTRFKTAKGMIQRLKRHLSAEGHKANVVYRNPKGTWVKPMFQGPITMQQSPIMESVGFLVDDRFSRKDAVQAAAWTLAAYQFHHDCHDQPSLKSNRFSLFEFGNEAHQLWKSSWCTITYGIGSSEIRGMIEQDCNDQHSQYVNPNESRQLLNGIDEFVFVHYGVCVIGYLETLMFDPEGIKPELKYLPGWDIRCGTVAEIVSAVVRLLIDASPIFTDMKRSPRALTIETILNCLDEDWFDDPNDICELENGLNSLMDDPGVPDQIGDVVVPHLRDLNDLWELMSARRKLLDRLPEHISRPVVQLVREVARHIKLASRLVGNMPYYVIHELYGEYYGTYLEDMMVTVVGRESYSFVNSSKFSDLFYEHSCVNDLTQVGFLIIPSVVQAAALMYSSNEIIRLIALLQAHAGESSC